MTLMGCEALPKRDPGFTPVQPVDLRLPPQTNGSIYQAGYDMRLFEDLTAKRVGDILTVKLKESTSAKKKSDLDVEKDNSVSATAPILSGIDPSFIFDKDISAKIASGYKFEGEGEANQSNELSGDITVTVVAVYPNGNLKIRGEKRVTLNDGNEYLRLSGIIRPIDIDESNVILSTKVADATIMYTGDGTLADSSKMGWFARFFYSPIFPF
jgi:flagellar L-ring protein precursor FlgH